MTQPQHDSKTRLLDAALLVIRGQGYTATSVDDICREAGLSKGSFFHHFRSKEDLALAAADHFAAMADRLFATAPYRALPDPRDRLLGYVEFRKSILLGDLREFTCLLGTMVQETYDSHPAIRRVCDTHISAHAAELAADVAEARRRYAPDAAWSAESLGLHMQAVIQGAFILAKARGGSEVARDCLDHLGRYLELLFGHHPREEQMSTSAHHGKFVWYELMTTDTRAAQRFYCDVIGWKAKDASQPGHEYTLFSAGRAEIAGMLPTPPEARGMPPCWMGYVSVENVDTCAKRIEAAGGAVHRAPADIPGVGRFAVVGDPQGAGFMLFTPTGDAHEPPAPGTPGTVGWHELHAGDGPSAFTFYADLFGWTKDRAMDMGEFGIYQIFAAGGPPIGAVFTRMPNSPGPGWLYYFNVEAIDAAAERIRRAGGRITNGPMEVPGGSWIVQCIDPQDAMFALVAPTR